MCTWRYRYPANLGTVKNNNKYGGTTIMQQWSSWRINNIHGAVTMMQQPTPTRICHPPIELCFSIHSSPSPTSTNEMQCMEVSSRWKIKL